MGIKLNILTLVFAFLMLVFIFWNLYNVPVVLTGIRSLLREKKKKNKKHRSYDEAKLPKVSIVIPAKNEEKVVGRLLDALMKVNYPSVKMEVIVVNDDSKDRTREICTSFCSRFPQIRLLNRKGSTTKASALNYGVSFASGEIIGTFDADNVPDADSLINAVRFFEDPEVAAVQGRICAINADENMLTKFLFYEKNLQYESYVRGKDHLGLYVSMGGTCQFIRRTALEEVNGWDGESITEDAELSLKLTAKDFKIKYASDALTWEENPRTFKDMIRQRVRWYKGNIELGFKYGGLLKKLSWKRLDAEMTLFGIYVLMACIINYFAAFWVVFLPIDFLTIVMRLTSLFVLIILACAGFLLVYMTRPWKIRNLLWLPFIYAYWALQSFIALYAGILVLLRRPSKWTRTSRSGYVTEDVKKTLRAINS